MKYEEKMKIENGPPLINFHLKRTILMKNDILLGVSMTEGVKHSKKKMYETFSTFKF